jgi:hypothetical protein
MFAVASSAGGCSGRRHRKMPFRYGLAIVVAADQAAGVTDPDAAGRVVAGLHGV